MIIDNRDDRLPWVFLPLDDDGEALLCLVQRMKLEDGTYEHHVRWMARCEGGREMRGRLLDQLRVCRSSWDMLGAMLLANGPDAMWRTLVEVVCPGGMPMTIGRA